MEKRPVQPQLDPAKRYYRIREASAAVGVPAYVLRFWERQFDGLRPKRTASGHRLYRRADVDLLLQIKRLLHERQYTIAGARQHLQAKAPPPADPAAGGADPRQPDPADPGAEKTDPRAVELLDRVYRELKHLRRMLDGPP